MANNTMQEVLMEISQVDNSSATNLPTLIQPMTPEYYLMIKFICNKILIPIIVSFGIVGNVLNLVVLTRKEMTSATNTFLIALAVSDVALLLVQIPHFLSYDQNLMKSHSFISFYRHFTILRYVLTNIFITCTCWITVAVTIERFISLRYITNPRLKCTTTRAKLAIVGIFVTAFVLHLTKFFEYVPNPDHTQPQPLLHTNLSKQKSYDTFVHITNITMVAILPVFLLIVVNSFLIYFLTQHRKRMQRHRTGAASSSVDVTHVTMIVIAMVLVFIVCHSFGVFLALVISVKGRREVFGNYLYLGFNQINTLLVTTNSSINFLLYSTISQKFRNTFVRIFLRGFHERSLKGSLTTSNNCQTFSTKPNGTSYVSQISTDSCSIGKNESQSVV